jgi:hypothetical protein
MSRPKKLPALRAKQPAEHNFRSAEHKKEGLFFNLGPAKRNNGSVFDLFASRSLTATLRALSVYPAALIRLLPAVSPLRVYPSMSLAPQRLHSQLGAFAFPLSTFDLLIPLIARRILTR